MGDQQSDLPPPKCGVFECDEDGTQLVYVCYGRWSRHPGESIGVMLCPRHDKVYTTDRDRMREYYWKKSPDTFSATTGKGKS